MATSAPEPLKPTAAEADANAATDEDILRLRSRLDRELAMVAQKLTDAEEEIVDIELSVRAQEIGARPIGEGRKPDPYILDPGLLIFGHIASARRSEERGSDCKAECCAESHGRSLRAANFL